MRVTMEMENGETLLCNKCGELFHGDAILDIDDEAESVEVVYCVPCTLRSSKESVNK